MSSALILVADRIEFPSRTRERLSVYVCVFIAADIISLVLIEVGEPLFATMFAVLAIIMLVAVTQVLSAHEFEE